MSKTKQLPMATAKFELPIGEKGPAKYWQSIREQVEKLAGVERVTFGEGQVTVEVKLGEFGRYLAGAIPTLGFQAWTINLDRCLAEIDRIVRLSFLERRQPERVKAAVRQLREQKVKLEDRVKFEGSWEVLIPSMIYAAEINHRLEISLPKFEYDRLKKDGGLKALEKSLPVFVADRLYLSEPRRKPAVIIAYRGGLCCGGGGG